MPELDDTLIELCAEGQETITVWHGTDRDFDGADIEAGQGARFTEEWTEGELWVTTDRGVAEEFAIGVGEGERTGFVHEYEVDCEDVAALRYEGQLPGEAAYEVASSDVLRHVGTEEVSGEGFVPEDDTTPGSVIEQGWWSDDYEESESGW